MKCEDVADLLLPALTEALADAEITALRGHLAECVRCAHDLPRISKAWTMLEQWSDVDVPAQLSARLLDLGHGSEGGNQR